MVVSSLTALRGNISFQLPKKKFPILGLQNLLKSRVFWSENRENADVLGKLEFSENECTKIRSERL